MTDVSVATREDIRELYDLQLRAFESEAEMIGSRNIPALLETYEHSRKDFGNWTVLVRRGDSGGIIGAVRFREEDGRIDVGRLMVAPGHRGQGIATALMHAVETFTRARVFELYTCTKSCSNIALYERLGYRTFRVERGERELSFAYMRKIREDSMSTKTIYLAGGCFWGLQKFFDQFDGVTETEVGYANGPDKAPSYQDVCGDSGHAETVRIVYDEDKISLDQLLVYYFMVIDPLSVNRQGHDEGVQYRTGVYYTDEAQLPQLRAAFEREREKAGAPLAVALEPLKNFFSAEEYHQKYLEKNPGGYCHIPDKYYHLTQR